MKDNDRFPIPGEWLSDEASMLTDSVARWAEREVVERRSKHREDFEELHRPALTSVMEQVGLRDLLWTEDGDEPLQATTLAVVLEQSEHQEQPSAAPDEGKQFGKLLRNLYRLFIECDCSMVEINPLVVTTEGAVMALDGKMSFEANALYRHPDVEQMRDVTEEDPAELEAGEFAEGSMAPKMEAAVAYLDAVDGEAIICLPEALVEAVDGTAGTHIRRGPPAAGD